MIITESVTELLHDTRTALSDTQVVATSDSREAMAALASNQVAVLVQAPRLQIETRRHVRAVHEIFVIAPIVDVPDALQALAPIVATLIDGLDIDRADPDEFGTSQSGTYPGYRLTTTDTTWTP